MRLTRSKEAHKTPEKGIMKMHKLAIFIAAGALLTGCARNPELYVGLTIEATTHTEIEKVLIKIQVLRDSYNRDLRHTLDYADFGQLPLIGVAVASAVLAINQPTNFGDTIAKIGIGTGAYAATRSIFAPSSMPDLYRRGLKATNCVLSEGSTFNRSEDQAGITNLQTAGGQLATAIQGLEAAAQQVPDGSDTAMAAELRTAIANAQLALQRARPILEDARKEVGAFKSAARVFDQTAHTISDAISAKAIVRTEFDRAAFDASIKALIPATSPAPAVLVSGGDDAGQVADNIRRAISNVDNSITATTLALPSISFGERLFEVKKCPALI